MLALNVPIGKNDLSTHLPQDLVNVHQRLGYTGVAFNYVVKDKLVPEEAEVLSPLLAKLKVPPRMRVLSRVTVVVSDKKFTYQLGLKGGSFGSFDVVAVQPESEDVFRACCTTLEIDVISFDFSKRHSFYIKRPMANAALDRGIVFEIVCRAAFFEGSARRNLIMNVLSLLHATQGRNVFLSCGSREPINVRSPHDLAAIARLFGLDSTAARKAVTLNCAAVLQHAQTRRAVKSTIEVACVETDRVSRAVQAVGSSLAVSTASLAPFSVDVLLQRALKTAPTALPSATTKESGGVAPMCTE